jgi:hypothetical protein
VGWLKKEEDSEVFETTDPDVLETIEPTSEFVAE